MERHEYTYPHVVEIVRESLVTEMGPYMIRHNEKQLAYYEEQAEIMAKNLARCCIVYSGQLKLDLYPEPQGERS